MAINFMVKRRIEATYARRLQLIFDFINKSIAGLSIADAALKIIEITQSAEYNRMVDMAVLNMITMVKAENEKSWRAAASTGSSGRAIYESLRGDVAKRGTKSAISQILLENARLIRSVPRDVAKRITQKTYEHFLQGVRVPTAMQTVMSEAPWLTPKRARLIARTEISKANAALTEVRSRDMGANWYIWRSSKDERVRHSHAFMEGVIINWDNSPNPESLSGERNVFGDYHAGCCPNCRCYAEPLIDSVQLANVVRVYTGGKIRSMGRNQFLRMIGREKVA